VIDLETAEPYVRAHRGMLFVIKVGGECLASPVRVQRVAREIAMIEAFGAHPLVVHGAGPQTDALQRGLGEEPRKVGGRRITSRLALRALRYATQGELGPDLALALSTSGARAVAVGASSGVLVASRRPPLIRAGKRVDFGHVGDLKAVDTSPLAALVKSGFIPVLSPPASDGVGGYLNVNADLVAARLAVELRADKLILLTGSAGILGNPEDTASLFSTLSLEELEGLRKKGAIVGGMDVKAEAIRIALEGGVARVHAVSGIQNEALLSELYTAEGSGTLITAEAVPGGGDAAPVRGPSAIEETVT
jgi:acetylglutamate kinase